MKKKRGIEINRERETIIVIGKKNRYKNGFEKKRNS